MFAGPGGFSTALEQAGIRVVWAGNHDAAACAVHSANHPETEHVREDLRVVDWGLLPPIDILVASPECRQHSTASQAARARDAAPGKARRKRSRALAYEVLHAVDALEPKAVIVENVVAYTRWRLFDHWLEGFRALGYHIEITTQIASHHGVPQRRERVFVVMTKKPMSAWALTFNRTPEPGVESIIDWDDGEWGSVDDLEIGARSRVEAGRRHGKRYWIQNVTGHRGKPLHEPFSTITCQDQHALVDGDRYRTITVRETARAMGFPDSYKFPVPATIAKAKLGDAVSPPPATAIIERVRNEMSL
jgi:DNA (cytosine-5)-methyltransferase 1